MNIFGYLPPWAWMWIIAIAIYAVFKCLMWRRAVHGGARATPARSFLFLVLWPGMDARSFLDASCRPEKPPLRAWLGAGVNFILGAFLLWGMARRAPGPLSAGWIGMIGMIFLFHFGFVKGLALYWQWNGICAGPLMRMPVAANSVGDFWGKRWNSAFRDLSFGLMFNSFRKWCGTRGATLLTFFISGLIHELVITLPAGGGYGLPTAYFTLQGAGLLCEHSHPARGWLRSALHGRLFAWLIVAGPAFALFPPPFVQRVIVPFMQAIGALPGGHL